MTKFISSSAPFAPPLLSLRFIFGLLSFIFTPSSFICRYLSIPCFTTIHEDLISYIMIDKKRPVIMKIKLNICTALILTFWVSCALGEYPKERTVTEKKTKNRTANHLIDEKSPYLLQHAYNPVDWYPWGDEAFAKAKKEDKPIFLSIGYSTCHWCHVMAHESFENEDIAHLLNVGYVCIKVDREERPDIDNVYMKVCQMMTGSGGWPLTIIMTPDKKPFFAGTYIPPESRQGRMGLPDLIKAVNAALKNERSKIDASIDRIIAALNGGINKNNGNPDLQKSPQNAFKWFQNRFDPQEGGFGSAPKFPSPQNLIFLLRFGHLNQNKDAMEMVYTTLEQMRLGGIYDQIGFGFHRYSTDRFWRLPHFEKMLYDQAMLIFAYTEAWQSLSPADHRKDLFEQTIDQVISYLERVMASTRGTFFSAEDADSDGEEGKFYVWKEAELKKILNPQEFAFVKQHFTVFPDGNFLDEASRQKNNANILYVNQNNAEGEWQTLFNAKQWQSARATLYDQREKRIHPAKDDKILTDWNGLTIGALAYAGRTLEQKRYIQLAEKAAAFFLTKMINDKGRLYHRYRDGEKSINAFLDDYAFLSWGLLELYAATLNLQYLDQAIHLINIAESDFWDQKDGGFHFSGKNNEVLISTSKELYDGALPSGNSVMLNNLFRLYHLTGNQKHIKMFENMISFFADQIVSQPGAYAFSVTAYMQHINPSSELVIVSKDDADRELIRQITGIYRPNLFLLSKNEKNGDGLSVIAPFTENQRYKGTTTFHLCQDHTCNLPTENIKTILSQLETGQ